MFKKFLIILFSVPLCYCQQFDDRCIVPNTMPSQNLPHEMSSSLFYKCHNGFLLLLTCPRGMKFDPFLSACLPDDLRDCSSSNTATDLIKIPTPPYITTKSEYNPIIPSTVSNPPISTSTESSLPPDDEIPVDSTTKMKIPTPPLITTILSALVPDKTPIVTNMSIYMPAFISSTPTIKLPDELPILISTMKIPTPPLLTTLTSLTETSSLETTAPEMSTNKTDTVPATNIPTAPTFFETSTKLFLPSLPVIEQLNNIEEKELS